MEVDNLDTLKLKLTKCEFGFKAGPSTVVSIFINGVMMKWELHSARFVALILSLVRVLATQL